MGLVFICLPVLFLVAFHFYLLAKEELLFWYGMGYTAATLLIGVITISIRASMHFFPHHYFIAFSLLPITRFFNPLTTILQGLTVGIFVEGVGRWGLEWLWETKRERELNDWFKAVQAGDQ